MSMPAQRPGRSKQDYRTPRDFLEVVKRRFGIYYWTFDFAADAENSVAGDSFWGITENSLAQPAEEWRAHLATDDNPSGWGWLNPPYADIAPWAKRCMEAGQLGARIVLLVPAGVGANWYRDYVDGHAHVLALNGRLSFDGKAPYPKDCMLCVYGLGVRGGFEVWDWQL